MHSAVHDMLKKYNCVTQDDLREAVREIILKIALREELFPGPAKTDNL